jgi:DNA gyrase/topoisomerase IV subunit B
MVWACPVVNALSELLEVTIRRDGNVHTMAFSGGDKTADLKGLR